MTKVAQHGYTNDNQIFVHFIVEKEEYTSLKDKIIDKLISEVEIPGFRKGKAPKDKALAHLSPQATGQAVVQEVLNTYSSQAVEAATNQAKQDNRVIANLELDPNPEQTGEQADGSFQMRVVADLLPAIDLSKVDSITIKQPTSADIVDLPDFVDFKKQELAKIVTEQNIYTPSDDAIGHGYLAIVDMHGSVDGQEMEGLHSHGMQVAVGAGNFLPVFEENLIGLKKGEIKEFDLPFPDNYVTELAGKTAQVKIKIVDVQKPKFSDIDELLENNENLKKFYKDKAALEADVENVYKARTEQVLDNIRRKRVVEELLKAVPDFALDSSLVDSETNRIFSTLLQEAQAKGITAAQALVSAGLSNKQVSEIEKLDKDGVKNEVEAYVKNEVKLTNILSMIYQLKVENKPTAEEFEATVQDALKDKPKYNIDNSYDEARVRNVINDRIIRQAAGNYLLDLAKKNAQ